MRCFTWFVAAFCVIGFVTLSCGKRPAAGAGIDPKLKGYIPPKAKVLAGLSLERLKQTDFYQRHQSQLSISALDQFSQQTGVDPRRDLSSFLFAWNGSDTLGMIHGSFQSSKLEKQLELNAKPERHGDLQFLGDGKRDLVFLPKGIALFGPPALLKSAVTQSAAGDGSIPEDLQLQMARLSSGAQAWLVSSGVISLSQLSLRSDAATMLSNISDYIDATATGITFSSGAAVDAYISCTSEEGSQRVHDALRGVIGLARLNTPDTQMDQLKVWDSIHVDRNGKQVHLAAEFTPELIDRFIGLVPSLGGRF